MTSVPLSHRLHQVRVYRAASHQAPPVLPTDAETRLTPPMAHQFRLLPVADQRHLLTVYGALIERGADDDTITAGLIHDVGKACAKCRITLLDRTLHVLLSTFARWPYGRFAAMDTAPAWCRGLHRLANHAQRGALAAAQAGYNDRVIELVRYHERGGNANDVQLTLLRQVDRSEKPA